MTEDEPPSGVSVTLTGIALAQAVQANVRATSRQERQGGEADLIAQYSERPAVDFAPIPCNSGDIRSAVHDKIKRATDRAEMPEVRLCILYLSVAT